MSDVNVNFGASESARYESDIAYLKGMCEYNQKYNTCNKVCEGCAYNYAPIFSMMPPHMQASVIRYSDMYYMQFVNNKEAAIHERKQTKIIIICVAALVVLLVMLCMFLMFKNISYAKVTYSDDTISEAICKVKENIKDINKDGEINCQDYSIMFKLYWDSHYDKDDCHIMYTVLKNIPTKREQPHCFVKVRKDGRWIYIEPQAIRGDYTLDTFWGNKNWKVLAYHTMYLGDDIWLATIP